MVALLGGGRDFDVVVSYWLKVFPWLLQGVCSLLSYLSWRCHTYCVRGGRTQPIRDEALFSTVPGLPSTCNVCLWVGQYTMYCQPRLSTPEVVSMFVYKDLHLVELDQSWKQCGKSVVCLWMLLLIAIPSVETVNTNSFTWLKLRIIWPRR